MQTYISKNGFSPLAQIKFTDCRGEQTTVTCAPVDKILGELFQNLRYSLCCALRMCAVAVRIKGTKVLSALRSTCLGIDISFISEPCRGGVGRSLEWESGTNWQLLWSALFTNSFRFHRFLSGKMTPKLLRDPPAVSFSYEQNLLT